MKTAASYIKKKYDCYKDYSEQSIRDVCHMWCEVIEEAQNDVKKEYEEKLRWIPISEKMPEPRKDISLKLENFSNSEITGFMGYSGEFYIKLTDIIDCDNVKLKCKVTHWRYFL